jgi:hypothetical protein
MMSPLDKEKEDYKGKKKDLNSKLLVWLFDNPVNKGLKEDL